MTFFPPAGHSGHAGPPGSQPQSQSQPHLDELAAMLLADGQPVDPPAARHAASCGLCTALVSAFRNEGRSLTSALSLDEADLAFLAGAGLPARVCARAGRIPLLEGQRDSPATLLALLLTALAGYGLWLLALPGFNDALSLAQRSGAVAVGTRMLTDWLIGLLIAFWGIFTAVDALPFLQNPALPLTLVALVAWLAIWLGPRLPLPAGRAQAAV
ncbi:MAG TPA: hypothetical protein VH257_15970 [Chloroflexota bacterium]|nr:hypothetical protein [Chloroflexota bacterium]